MIDHVSKLCSERNSARAREEGPDNPRKILSVPVSNLYRLIPLIIVLSSNDRIISPPISSPRIVIIVIIWKTRDGGSFYLYGMRKSGEDRPEENLFRRNVVNLTPRSVSFRNLFVGRGKILSI